MFPNRYAPLVSICCGNYGGKLHQIKRSRVGNAHHQTMPPKSPVIQGMAIDFNPLKTGDIVESNHDFNHGGRCPL